MLKFVLSVAYTQWGEQTLRIGFARPMRAMIHHALPGTILSASQDGIQVATGAGVLTLLQLQLPGGKMLPVADFYNARRNEFTSGKKFT
jgi:methionyl-tRNA formyltransferase